MNRSFEVCSSVDAQPPNTPPWYQLDSEDHQWQTHRLFAILFEFLRYLLSIQWRWCSLCPGLSWQKDRVLLTDFVPLCNILSYWLGQKIWQQNSVLGPNMVAAIRPWTNHGCNILPRTITHDLNTLLALARQCILNCVLGSTKNCGYLVYHVSCRSWS